MRGARRKAKSFGPGATIVRCFNRENLKTGYLGEWTSSPLLWVWDGVAFKKTPSLDENRWFIVETVWPRGPLLKRFHDRCG